MAELTTNHNRCLLELVSVFEVASISNQDWNRTECFRGKCDVETRVEVIVGLVRINSPLQ